LLTVAWKLDALGVNQVAQGAPTWLSKLGAIAGTKLLRAYHKRLRSLDAKQTAEEAILFGVTDGHPEAEASQTRGSDLTLIRRLLFDYVRDAPIARADQDDFIIFNEEREGPNLRHLLDDICRHWIELNVIGYHIVDRVRSGVLLLYVRVLKNDFSNDVLLFRC
jgi:hypothetical protein